MELVVGCKREGGNDGLTAGDGVAFGTPCGVAAQANSDGSEVRQVYNPLGKQLSSSRLSLSGQPLRCSINDRVHT